VLRDWTAVVVDSLNYGLLVEPWAAEGYQGESGAGRGGCRVSAPGSGIERGPGAGILTTHRSAGRFPDGADTDSNCTDFLLQSATTLPSGSAAGATNIKVASVAGFASGETIRIDGETAVIATVGTGGATALLGTAAAGATVLPVASVAGFSTGQTITVGSESAVVESLNFRGGARITVSAGLKVAHPAGTPISGSGITLTAPLARAHASGAQVADNVPTPGGPNRYSRRR